jgi:Fic family protein
MDAPDPAVQMSMTASMEGPAAEHAPFGPFFPGPGACDALLERAATLIAEGHRLEAASGQLGAALRPLLRVLNACASSELDGVPVGPRDLERAAAGEQETDPDRARALGLACAHVAAEQALAAALPSKRVALYAPELVQCVHAELHRITAPGEVEPSAEYEAPGAWRERPAPGHADPGDIAEQLEWWQAAYGRPFGLERAVVSAVCASHRLAWVRPFEHGNGRTARLHTLLALGALGLTQGLWSPYRGMARERETYRSRLRTSAPLDADITRRELEAFATWQLDICLDEARAARERLDTERLKERMSELLAWLAARPWVMGSERSVIKPDALEALHYTAITGPVERSRFIAMLGLQHRTGRRVLSSLIDFGLLVSDSSRAPVRFNLPLASLRFLFPGFWPDAAASEEPGPAPESSWPLSIGVPGRLATGLAGGG